MKNKQRAEKRVLKLLKNSNLPKNFIMTIEDNISTLSESDINTLEKKLLTDTLYELNMIKLENLISQFFKSNQ